jgi:cell division protein FtsB
MNRQEGIAGRRVSGIIMIIFLLVSFYMFYILITQQGILSANNKRINEYNLLIEKEKEINANLVQKSETILSDENVEKWAREKLGLVRPGEKVFIAIGN